MALRATQPSHHPVSAHPPPRYKTVLVRHPGAPAEVRLGLAACFFRGGQLELAQAAYERCARSDKRFHSCSNLVGLSFALPGKLQMRF